MDAIKTSGLTKSYGSKRAVDDMSLTVGAGEVYGFVGRNGAGKSTVMKMLAGLVLPTAGEIEVLGERQAPGSTSRRLGALIENPGVHPGLSGLDNVMVRALALGVPREDARFVLPNAAATRLVMTMNARELMHFFSLRCCNRAQWEIREMAWQMLALCKQAAPALFEHAGPACAS